jgi:septin family protein
MDSPTDRLLLTVIDTPGLEFSPGRELVLEQQIISLVHEIDSRFAETLIEESKVVRTSKGDQHIHL